MPNHVSQRLTIKGDENIVAYCREVIGEDVPEKESTSYDGDVVCLKPDGNLGWYDKDTGKATTRTEDGYKTVQESGPLPEGWKIRMEPAHRIHISFERIIPPPPFILQSAGLSFEDKEANPGRNWYDWNVKHWGSKWGAYDTGLDGDVITFSTAWGTGTPVIRALSEMFPELEFHLSYIDEGWGFAGESTFKAGEVDNRNIPCEEDNEEFVNLYTLHYGEPPNTEEE